MAMRKLTILFSFIFISIIFVSCTEDQIPTNIKEEQSKLTGTIYNENGIVEDGAIVQLKVANYNPILRSAVNYDKISCRGMDEDPEILEFETTTDKDGNYSFSDIPAGTYTLSAKDSKNKKAVYKPNIKISDKDSVIGNDTLQEYIEITIHVPDSYVSENSFFYIPGTDIYFHISKAGTMYIQVPVGLLSLVFCEDSELFLETLFLIIKNLLINDPIVIDTHEVYKPEFMIFDTTGIYSTKDTLLFYAWANSSEESHPIEYRFMWDDTVWSEWTYESKDIARVFPYPGFYSLYAQARCAIDTTIVSVVSDPIFIEIRDSIIPNEWIYPPEFLHADHFVKVRDYGWYSAAFAYSNVTSEFEYQFDWGDGTYSEWLSDSLIYGGFDTTYNDSGWDTLVNGVEEYHQWNRAGNYNVFVRARSAFDSSLISDWSWMSIYVQVKDDISPDLPTPYIWGPKELRVNEEGIYTIMSSGSLDTTKIKCVVDWGDGSFFEWTGFVQDSMTYDLKHTYNYTGNYIIKAIIMDAYDSSITSDWSDSIFVLVTDSGMVMQRPNMPVGDSVLYVSQIGSYFVEGFITPLGDSAQFRFDWGDSISLGEWEPEGTFIFDQNAWQYPGYYAVRCQARSVIDTTVVSDWSYPFWVQVMDTIVNDTTINDTIINDTVIHDTVIIIDTVIVIDTIIDDSGNVIIDTIFNDTSFIDTSYLQK